MKCTTHSYYVQRKENGDYGKVSLWLYNTVTQGAFYKYQCLALHFKKAIIQEKSELGHWKDKTKTLGRDKYTAQVEKYYYDIYK